MRDIEVIDAELRLLAAIRHCSRSQRGQPSTTHIDALLDEPDSQPHMPRDDDR